jgi:Flp pilus assembly pilin Flp
MNALRKRGLEFLRPESGATATEYAVMLALIFLVCVGAVGSMGLTVASKLVIPGW